MLENKRKKREEDMKKAVCIKCGTQCTSTVQLGKHINSSRCIKLQKKLGK